jgi:hypothetical protein
MMRPEIDAPVLYLLRVDHEDSPPTRTLLITERQALGGANMQLAVAYEAIPYIDGRGRVCIQNPKPSERIRRLEAEVARLQARIAELEARG